MWLWNNVYLFALQDEERVRELEDRDCMLLEMQKLLDTARDEKRECDEKLATAKTDMQRLTLQLQQKDTEIQRSRCLVRLMMMMVVVMFTLLLMIRACLNLLLITIRLSLVVYLLRSKTRLIVIITKLGIIYTAWPHKAVLSILSLPPQSTYMYRPINTIP